MTMQEFRREWENIDDRFVLEAAGMQEKSEKRGKRGGGWGRRAALIAAGIALLIGIPAFLFWRFSTPVAVAGLGEAGEVDVVTTGYSPTMNSVRGLPIFMRCPGGTIEATTTAGEIFPWGWEGAVGSAEDRMLTYTLENEGCLLWGTPLWIQDTENRAGHEAYITLTFRQGSRITGAAIMEITRLDDDFWGFYRAALLDAIHFEENSPVNGRERVVQDFFRRSMERDSPVPSLALVKEGGEAFANVRLAGFDGEEIKRAWGEPDDRLSGFWGDIWYLDIAGHQFVTLYYDADGKVMTVKIEEKKE